MSVASPTALDCAQYYGWFWHWPGNQRKNVQNKANNTFTNPTSDTAQITVRK